MDGSNISAQQHSGQEPESRSGAITRYDAVVVGAGPTGFKLARDLSKEGARVALLNSEALSPYNRVKLTPLLAGEVQLGSVMQPGGPSAGGATLYSGMRVLSIDPAERLIETAAGRFFAYKKLALCVGSIPFVPPIPGADAQNVFTFRDAKDVEALKARSFSARKVVVIGGGLLGLEAARGMAALGAETIVVEHEARLMPRQLDSEGAQLLKANIAALGVDALTGERVREIEAPFGRVEAVSLSNGQRLDADTVVICTGVKPNTELARKAGLAIGRGITVSPEMRTSDPNIFAAGECVECLGEIEGLVGPCLEQASVAAASMRGEKARYERKAAATKLKVVGTEVFSMGPIESLEERGDVRGWTWRDPENALYRRIFVGRNRLLGALAIGEWSEVNRVQQAIARGATLPMLGRMRFDREGIIWPASDELSPADWAPNVIVCNCTGVTRGQLGDAMKAGALTPEMLRAETGASSVCGTCKPLVEEIAGGGGAPEPVRMSRTLTGVSIAAGIAALVTLGVPRIPFADSFDPRGVMETLWLDNIAKQWSGYILLGLSVCAALIGLRKRIRFLDRLGGYDWWRVTHLIIGVASALVLFAHTGFRTGWNLTFALMLCFLSVMLFGAIAGFATGEDHKLRAAGYSSASKPAKTLPTWLHVLAIWPLPLLLGAHILSVYAY